MDSGAGRKRKGDPDEYSDLGHSPAKQRKTESSYSSTQRVMDSGAGRKPKGDPNEYSDLGHSPAKQRKTESSYSSTQRVMDSGAGRKRKGDPDAEHSDLGRSPAKQRKTGSSYSSISQRIMASMGYQPGKGLGKSGMGIAEPIEESIHKGRRGLGYILEGLEKEEVQWELEEVSYDNKPEWLQPSHLPVPSDLTEWSTVGQRKDTIDDETSFCDLDILHNILNAKSVFDELSDKEFLDARLRSNPFETIKGGIFQNRAAMKMANIDAVFDFMFTNPKKTDGKELLSPLDVLYFADICAGPGGFSEYVLWRKKWHAKGFGFTLKDPDSGSDFKLDQFLAAPCETFDPHYGVGGFDGNGDITIPDNLMAFQDYVWEQSEGNGAHFVMGDGGISVEGEENIQEILTKQLVLCQYICALSILRIGGHFVCKVFDMFTPFSVGLFYLLYRCFRQVCIFKPVTSRPANSERYVVCRELLPGSDVVHEYLFGINKELWRLKREQPHLDVLEVVPLSVLKEDDTFSTYIRAYNDSFGVNQTLNLQKLQYFVKNSNLQDTRQADIRRRCLELWNVPNQPRTVPSSESSALQTFDEFWKQLTPSKMDKPVQVSLLNSAKFLQVSKDPLDFFEDIHSWKWCWACGKRLMLVGLGVPTTPIWELAVWKTGSKRNKVEAWDMTGSKAVFSTKRELQGLELPKGTVIEVDLTKELLGEGRGQRREDTVYIVDVIAIHGKLYGNKPLKERHLLAGKLCKVLNKPCRRGTVQLKTKTHYRVAELPKHFEGLSLRECKDNPMPVPTYPVSEDTLKFIAPVGVIFFKAIRDPWQLHLSKSGKLYFFNQQTGQSLFECPTTSVASYLNVLSSRHIWYWKKPMFQDLCGQEEVDTGNVSDHDELTRSYLCHKISQILGQKS